MVSLEALAKLPVANDWSPNPNRGNGEHARLVGVSSLAETDRRRPTYADIEALPENVVGEILAGELVVSPRPSGTHAGATSCLGALLNVWFEQGIGGPGGWWIVDEPELSLRVDPDYDPVVPDIAGWRVAATMGERYVAPQCDVVPDWVCETLSPGTTRRDRMLKMPFYARAGVGHLWLTDPVQETIEVYRRLEGHWLHVTTAGGDAQVALEPFDAATIDLVPVWGRRREG